MYDRTSQNGLNPRYERESGSPIFCPRHLALIDSLLDLGAVDDVGASFVPCEACGRLACVDSGSISPEQVSCISCSRCWFVTVDSLELRRQCLVRTVPRPLSNLVVHTPCDGAVCNFVTRLHAELCRCGAHRLAEMLLGAAPALAAESPTEWPTTSRARSDEFGRAQLVMLHAMCATTNRLPLDTHLPSAAHVLPAVRVEPLRRLLDWLDLPAGSAAANKQFQNCYKIISIINNK